MFAIYILQHAYYKKETVGVSVSAETQKWHEDGSYDK